MLLLDSGDLFFAPERLSSGDKDYHEKKAAFIARAYKAMGYDAINVGELDVSHGVEFLLSISRKEHLPLVSSNILWRDTGKPVFQPYIIKNLGKLKVGIFGLLMKDTPLDERIRVRDPIETAREMVDFFKGKADLIVAITHQGLNIDRVLAEMVEGIDIIIGGHSMEGLKEPVGIKKTKILQASKQGKYIGRVLIDTAHLKKGSGLSGAKIQCDLIPIEMRISEDSSMLKLLQDFKRSTTISEIGKDVIPREPQFVSFRNCGNCHTAQLQLQMEKRHFRAYETLKRVKESSNRECVRCHTTGYGLSGGFGNRRDSSALEGVQCESCHGAGLFHSRNPGIYKLKRQVPEIVCRQCHTDEKDPEFNYERDLKKAACAAR